MKILIFNNEQYQAEKIIKTANSIIGYNGDRETFAFRGINDFSQFQLTEGQEWDIDELTDLKQQLATTQEALDFLIMGGM